MLLSDEVTCQFVLSSVVSKHLLLTMSVLCLLLDQQIDVYISFSNKSNSQQEYIILLYKVRFKCIVIYHCTRISRNKHSYLSSKNLSFLIHA